jgi:hypothetical protein
MRATRVLLKRHNGAQFHFFFNLCVNYSESQAKVVEDRLAKSEAIWTSSDEWKKVHCLKHETEQFDQAIMLLTEQVNEDMRKVQCAQQYGRSHTYLCESFRLCPVTAVSAAPMNTAVMRLAAMKVRVLKLRKQVLT